LPTPASNAGESGSGLARRRWRKDQGRRSLERSGGVGKERVFRKYILAYLDEGVTYFMHVANGVGESVSFKQLARLFID
jgi:hypothetical protein